MIELYLDGMRAIPNKDMSIKVTAENPYFTKSASYTYDVDLPLDVPENLRIFGHINRIDVTKESKRYAARLIVDNQPVIVGEAHITSISDKSVKVQLLGEGAAYNFGNKADKLYVDELDMGNWYGETWADWSVYRFVDGELMWTTIPEEDRDKVTINDLFRRCLGEDPLYIPPYSSMDSWLANVYGKDYPWVAYPILNSNSDVILNEPYGISNEYYQRSNMAIQPYVWKMAELVAKATGYTLDREDNYLYTNDLYRKIFIASATSSILCTKSLPHWTVNEWWTQIEHAFGVIADIDYLAKRIRLISIGRYYSEAADNVEIKDVADEFNGEMESDEVTDITNDSVGFDSDFDPGYLLQESIMSNATVIDEGMSSQELLEWAKLNRDKLGKNCIWRCSDGRHFIYQEGMTENSPGLLEVNMCRSRFPENTEEESDPEIELKIVPCSITEVEIKHFTGLGEGIGSGTTTVGYSGEILTAPGPGYVLANGEIEEETTVIDIEGILSGEDEDPTSDDKIETMYIAIENNGVWISQKIKNYFGKEFTVSLPVPITVERMEMSFANGQVMKYGKGMSLSLIDIEGLKTLASESLSGAMKINTGARMAIKFLSDTIPDVSSIFMIRNKRFVCHKIEATVKPDGLDRLLTGYFYELL